MISDGLVVALDGDIGVDLDTEVKDSSEIAFLPPVSGGWGHFSPKTLKVATSSGLIWES